MKNDQQSIVLLLVTWTTHGPLKLRREEIEKKKSDGCPDDGGHGRGIPIGKFGETRGQENSDE